MAEGERERILTAPLSRLCWSLSLPAVAGLMLVGAATFADAAFVGHTSGSTELGAILLGFPLTMVASAVSALIGSGAGALLSRAMGADDDGQIAEAYGAFALSTLVAGIVITVAGVFAAAPLLSLMGASGEMLAVGTRYTRIVMAGSLCVSFVFGASFLIRGEGRIADAMVILAAGSLLNVALDAVWIVGLDGGAVGAGYATLVTQVVTAVVTLRYLTSGRLRVPLRGWRMTGLSGHVRVMVRDGFAASLLYTMGIVQQVLVFRACAAWGTSDDVVFAGAHLRLLMVALVPAWAISMAIAPVVGIAQGAGNTMRARDALKIFSFWATVASTAVWLVATLTPEALMSTLVHEVSVVAPRADVLRLLWLSVPILGVQLVAAAYLSAIGRGMAAAAIIACRNVLVLGPLIWLLPRLIGLGGVWAALVLADVASLGVCLVLLRSGQSNAATNTESAADSEMASR